MPILVGMAVMAAIVIICKAIFRSTGSTRAIALLAGAVGALTTLKLKSDPYALQAYSEGIVIAGIVLVIVLLKGVGKLFK